ncbi:MAG: hypothetical protein GY953_00540, partial [bacterium]|nr:hypothetical protein [bacterium]
MDAYAHAREQFASWRSRYPANPFDADRHLDLVNRRYLSDERLASLRRAASSFGSAAAELAATVEGYRSQPPELVTFDGAGNAIEKIRFAAGYERAGEILWGSGLLAQAGAA